LAALHDDDRMMAILANRRRGESQDELRLCLPDHLFESERRNMVALVNNELSIPETNDVQKKT
jgi:hypothetical protein